MRPLKIKEGAKFGDWTVLHQVKNYKRNRAYLCRCKCGNTKVIVAYRLKSPNGFQMCRECSFDANKTHGDAQQSRRGQRHSIYIAWDNMLRRCENPGHPSYHWYGARGISVCPEWHDYNKFKEWAINNGWEKGLSIDRINNDGNYSPDNCRWTTQNVQARNNRTVKFETINGRTETRGDWEKIFGVSDWFVRDRMRKYNASFIEAIQMPRKRARNGV